MFGLPTHSAIATLLVTGSFLQLYARLLIPSNHDRGLGHELLPLGSASAYSSHDHVESDSYTIEHVYKRPASVRRNIFALVVLCGCVRVGLLQITLNNVECTGVSVGVSWPCAALMLS